MMRNFEQELDTLTHQDLNNLLEDAKKFTQSDNQSLQIEKETIHVPLTSCPIQDLPVFNALSRISTEKETIRVLVDEMKGQDQEIGLIEERLRKVDQLLSIARELADKFPHQKEITDARDSALIVKLALLNTYEARLKAVINETLKLLREADNDVVTSIKDRTILRTQSYALSGVAQEFDNLKSNPDERMDQLVNLAKNAQPHMETVSNLLKLRSYQNSENENLGLISSSLEKKTQTLVVPAKVETHQKKKSFFEDVYVINCLKAFFKQTHEKVDRKTVAHLDNEKLTTAQKMGKLEQEEEYPSKFSRMLQRVITTIRGNYNHPEMKKPAVAPRPPRQMG